MKKTVIASLICIMVAQVTASEQDFLGDQEQKKNNSPISPSIQEDSSIEWKAWVAKAIAGKLDEKKKSDSILYFLKKRDSDALITILTNDFPQYIQDQWVNTYTKDQMNWRAQLSVAGWLLNNKKDIESAQKAWDFLKSSDRGFKHTLFDVSHFSSENFETQMAQARKNAEESQPYLKKYNECYTKLKAYLTKEGNKEKNDLMKSIFSYMDGLSDTSITYNILKRSFPNHHTNQATNIYEIIESIYKDDQTFRGLVTANPEKITDEDCEELAPQILKVYSKNFKTDDKREDLIIGIASALKTILMQ